MAQRAKWRVCSQSGSTWNAKNQGFFRRHCSDELPQADVELAALLGRVLLWGYPASSPLGLHTATDTEVGVLFVPGMAAFFPTLFKKIRTCVCACTQWLCLLTKLWNMQKFAFLPVSITQHQENPKSAFQTTRVGQGHLPKSECSRIPGDTWRPHRVSSTTEPAV